MRCRGGGAGGHEGECGVGILCGCVSKEFVDLFQGMRDVHKPVVKRDQTGFQRVAVCFLWVVVVVVVMIAVVVVVVAPFSLL